MKIEVIPERKEYEDFLEFYPPQLANKFLPDWYKNSGKLKSRYNNFLNQIDENNAPMTVKNCPAIVDALTTGIILPLWGHFDFATFIDEETNDKIQAWDFTGKNINGSNVDEFVQYHTENQFENMPVKKTVDGRLLKIKCPYKFIVPEGYNIYYTDPFYTYRRSIRLLSGVVEADKWGFITFPFEILEESFTITAGEPFVHLFIYKREEEKINLNLRNGTDEEYETNKKHHRELFITAKHYKDLKTR